MSNYPEGSMRGSGIYEEEFVIHAECPECGYAGDTEVFVDDWRNATATCVECDAQWELTEDD